MAVYTGATPPGPGIVFKTMCFTGWDAALFRWLIPQIQVGSSILFGGGLGFIGSFIFGPEVFPQLAGAMGGAIAGAIIGGALTIYTLLAGACTCPPGTDGFCIALFLLVVPGTTTPVPIYPYILPDSAGCTTVMPAGCP